MHKYLLKVFYNRTKKKYNLQIWQYNVYYIYIIAIKDPIFLEKAKEKEKLSMDIADIITLAEVV